MALFNPVEYERRKAARRAREAQSRDGRLRSAAQGAGLAAGMIVTGAQAYQEPAQNSTNTQGNYVDSQAENRRANQARGQRRDTTYKGRQRGGSGRQG